MNFEKLNYIVRKNAHAFEYIVLALMVSNLLFAFNKKGKDAIVYILFICLFYAVTDEFHQSFVPVGLHPDNKAIYLLLLSLFLVLGGVGISVFN